MTFFSINNNLPAFNSLMNNTRLMKISLFQTVAAPKSNEWSKFAKSLQEMKQQATEREEEALSLSSITSPLR